MKNMAIGILLVLLLSVFIEPMVETANVFREKLVIGTALSNAFRAAKDRSLEYERMRELDAVVEEDRFKQYFADAFEDVMNVTRSSSVGSEMTFASDDGKYSTFYMTLDFDEEMDYATNQLQTNVNVKVESAYKFKSKYLKLAESANKDVDLQLVGERHFTLKITN